MGVVVEGKDDELGRACALRGWEFIVAFLTLQVAGDKKA